MDIRSTFLAAFTVVGTVAGVALVLLGDALMAGDGAMLIVASLVAAVIVVGLYLAGAPTVEGPSTSR